MFDAYVAFQARLRPTAFALITPRRWATYAQLDADVSRFAAGLSDLGVSRDLGVVSIGVGNGYLAHVMLLALARLGVASSPHSDPSPDLHIALSEANGPRQLSLSADWIAKTFRAEPRPMAPPRTEPDDLGRVMMSSGTTRTARRVPRTWRMLEGNTRTCALTYCANKPGRWACLTGLDTGLGQAMTLAAWSQGSTMIADYDAKLLAESLEALGPAIIGVTPFFLRKLLAELPVRFQAPSGLRIVSTGAVLAPELAREARLRLNAEILISYGAAETGSTTLADGAWLETWAGAAGYAVPGARVEVVDEVGAAKPPGELGEIRIFSDRQSSGYLGDATATAGAFRDGGFYPGDLGRLMDDGLLVVEGRLDDRMDLGRLKLSPEPLEAFALSYPGVLDAAAYTAPDVNGQDLCWLAVVGAEGLDRQGLAIPIARQDPSLPPFNFAWTQEIPRNAMGKIERRRLRDETLAALSRSASPESAPGSTPP